MEEGHQGKEKDCIDDIAQAHGLFPHLDRELVRHWLLILPFALLVETSAHFIILGVTQLVYENLFIRGRQVEDGSADVCLALPKTANDSINMIDLEKFVQFQL